MQVIPSSLAKSRSNTVHTGLLGLIISLVRHSRDVINEICALVCDSLTQAGVGIIVYVARALRISTRYVLDQPIALFVHKLT